MFGRNGKFLDYAAGYGVFVRLMWDVGFDFEWADKYTTNLFSDGFEWNLKDGKDAITLFEAFEHFVDPVEEIENLLEHTNTIIFSTQLRPEPLPAPESWNYYGLHHGQHVSFYSLQTFNFIAKRFNLKYYNIGSLHILTRLKIPKLKLFLAKLSRFGLGYMVGMKIKSKTYSDYILTVDAQKGLNKITS